MVAPYGKGMVGVSGPHPEADQSWYDNADLVNPDGIRPDIAYDLVETTTRRQATPLKNARHQVGSSGNGDSG
jgi:hypothetical protein